MRSGAGAEPDYLFESGVDIIPGWVGYESELQCHWVLEGSMQLHYQSIPFSEVNSGLLPLNETLITVSSTLLSF